jgi:hypothetical protein
MNKTLPDFLYRTNTGLILSGVYEDADVSEEWNNWLLQIRTTDIQKISDACIDCCEELNVNNHYIGEVFQWLIDNGYSINKTPDEK